MIDVEQHWLFAAAIVYIAVIGVWETMRPAYPQAKTQTQRRIANFAFAALHLSLVLALPLTQVSAAASAKVQHLGLLNHLALPSMATIAMTAVLASLIAYLTHVILHKVPMFWRFHAIHHGDCELDASTALRHHPGEILLMVAIQTPAVVLLGLDPATLAFLYACEWLYGLFAHANVRLPKSLDKALGFMLVTPAMHAIHHSADRKDADSNYGAIFSGWDRLFGTFRATANPKPQFRIETENTGNNPGLMRALGAALLAPVR